MSEFTWLGRTGTCLVAACTITAPATARAQLTPRHSASGAILLSVSAPLAAPASHETGLEPSAGQVVSVAAAAGVIVGGLLLAGNLEPAPCAPCDPSGVPGIDRGTIRTVQGTWGSLTDVAVLGLIGGTWADLIRRDDQAQPYFRASVESFAWTVALTQVLKVAVKRIRPFMYSEDAARFNNADARQSFPSGHTSAAFAIATSYFLSMQRLENRDPYWIFGIAAFVGAGRVLAGKHWITDVLAGAALGTATALVVNEVRFH